MKAKIYLIIPVFFFLVSSCSLNKKFYYTKTPYVGIQTNDRYKISSNFFKVSSKDSLNYVILEPNKLETKATLFMCHGNGGNISNWIGLAEKLVEDNYKVVMFDYRGYGRSTGRPSHKNVLKDSNSLLNHILENEKKEVYLWGFSLGGNLAIVLAHKNQQKISGVIIEAPFTSNNDIARYHAPKILKPFSFVVNTPYSSKEVVSDLHMPMILFASKEDKVVPYSMSEKLYHLASSHKKLYEVKGKHCEGLIKNKKFYLEKIDSLVSVGK